MIPELGHFALILALGTAVTQVGASLLGAVREDRALMALGRAAALVQFLLVSCAFAALTWCYVTSDFSVVTVASNSHTAKPLLYKISGVWGNHEGSILLWTLILTVYGAGVAAFGDHLPPKLRARVIGVQGAIGVGFLSFALLTSNPFARLVPVPAEGEGLNPLLQDPGLAFHPPLLYLGYVGFSIAFSFALAALMEGVVSPAWARWVRPWTLAAWGFLTGGIALGSWWAYYELGWGGWWFWDPVENASLMPWLAGTALLHSAIVAEKRDTLKSWCVFLAILTFSLSLLGTFLVRSGVLNSVHAFASDPARGIFILAFLGITVGGSLILYAWRAPALQPTGFFQPISREGALVVNNLLLMSAAAAILTGTLYPLFLDAVSGEKISVGPPYFNKIFVPLMMPLAVLMGIGPLLAWKRGDWMALLHRLKFVAAVTVGCLALGWIFFDARSFLSVMGLAIVLWLIGSIGVDLAGRTRLFSIPPLEAAGRAKILPRSFYGMMLAHLGFALMVLGITVSETWSDSFQGVLRPEMQASVGGYEFIFMGVGTAPGSNYVALRGQFKVMLKDRLVTVMEPEIRRYTAPPAETTEAAIRPTLLGDLYSVIGTGNATEGYAVRLYYKPLVSWIWLGALTMMVGALVSLSDRRHRVGAPRRSVSSVIERTM